MIAKATDTPPTCDLCHNPPTAETELEKCTYCDAHTCTTCMVVTDEDSWCAWCYGDRKRPTTFTPQIIDPEDAAYAYRVERRIDGDVENILDAALHLRDSWTDLEEMRQLYDEGVDLAPGFLRKLEDAQEIVASTIPQLLAALTLARSAQSEQSDWRTERFDRLNGGCVA